MRLKPVEKKVNVVVHALGRAAARVRAAVSALGARVARALRRLRRRAPVAANVSCKAEIKRRTAKRRVAPAAKRGGKSVR